MVENPAELIDVGERNWDSPQKSQSSRDYFPGRRTKRCWDSNHYRGVNDKEGVRSATIPGTVEKAQSQSQEKKKVKPKLGWQPPLN